MTRIREEPPEESRVGFSGRSPGVRQPLYSPEGSSTCGLEFLGPRKEDASGDCRRDRFGGRGSSRRGTADAESAQDAAKKVATKGDSAKKAETPTPKPEKLGVLIRDPRAFLGYNLINPGRKQTYLFRNQGRVVHSWTSEHPAGPPSTLLTTAIYSARGPQSQAGFSRPGRERSDSRVRLGRQSRLGFRVSQRKAFAPP